MALELACEHLLSLQDEAGWWQGELQTNVTMDAEDMLLREFLGVRRADETERSAAWIRSQQRADGTWANFYGGPGDLSTTIEAYWALRLAGDGPTPSTCAPPPSSSASRAAWRKRARVHAPVARAVRPVVVGGRPGAAAGDRPAALVVSAEHLRLRLLGAPDDRRAVAGENPPARRASCRSTWTSCRSSSAAGLGRAPGRAARALAGSRGPHPARLRTPAAATAAADRAGARRALDRAPPGGRRLVGRDPAAVGLLADRPAPVRLRARSPGHAPWPGGPGRLHGRGPRRLARASAPRPGPAGAWKPASRPCGTRRWR